MNRRLLLVVAFLLIAGGVYGLLTRNSGDQGDNAVVTSSANEELYSVRVIARDIEKGAFITQSDFRTELITSDNAQKWGVVNKEPFTLVKGSLVAESLKAGDVFPESLVITPDHPEYVDLIITPGMVPYPVEFSGSNGYPMILGPGDLVDVVMISSLNQNLAKKDSVDRFEGLSVSPLLRARKVLKVGDDGEGVIGEEISTTVVLELSRKEVSQLMLARRVGVLDLHKSTQEPLPQVRAGDVLPDLLFCDRAAWRG